MPRYWITDARGRMLGTDGRFYGHRQKRECLLAEFGSEAEANSCARKGQSAVMVLSEAENARQQAAFSPDLRTGQSGLLAPKGSPKWSRLCPFSADLKIRRRADTANERSKADNSPRCNFFFRVPSGPPEKNFPE